jgi:glycine cleavage system H protein
MADYSGYCFTKEHEWVKADGDRAKVGISDYAQHKLGDITFVELPPVGKNVSKGGVLTLVESVKAASDIYAPVSGKVTKVNFELESAPELVNCSPYDKGWIVEMELRSPDEISSLMDYEAYAEYVKGLE